MSCWAQEGVAAAYQSRAVSDEFDLGKDYTKPITRAQMARLTVNLVISEQKITLANLAGQLGIELEQVPQQPAQTQPESNAPTAGGEGTEAHLEEALERNNSKAKDIPPVAEDTAADNTTADTSLATDDEAETGGAMEGEAENSDPLDGGLPLVVSGSFSDTKSIYVEAAAQLGIVKGVDGLFRPDDKVSLANNHSMDYLQRGYDDTVRYLSPYVQVSAYDRMPIVTAKGVRIGFASNVGWSFGSAQKQFIDNAIRSRR